MKHFTEDNLVEQPSIEWFKQLGYEYKFGPDISPDGILDERGSYENVILENRLRGAIRRLNSELSDEMVDDVIYKVKRVENPNLEIANREIYKLLTEGVKIRIKGEGGERRGKIVKVIDFKDPQNNEFLAVNQFSIKGKERIRRPDLVVFINGIPIAIFELKNPKIEEATIQTAYQQLQDYKKDIPEIFKYNQILVISDSTEARYGGVSSSWKWFRIWRGIENPEEKLKGVSELEVLIKGIFQKNRILDIIENFIVFEADSEKDVSKYTKKICLYHQYFGVNKAIQRTIKALKPNGNGKIGVFWHTQGSGKTLSAIFYVNKVRGIDELQNPTFLFLTDRNDLDNQFYKTFLRNGYNAIAKQARSIKDLKGKLQNAGAELFFTTMQKFSDFGELSDRNNIIVVVDEAHRSQYAKFAAKVRKAIPNASFMGITATPIDLSNRSTELVFGPEIDKYPMSKSVEDGSTVPIYYESRLVPLHLSNYFVDEEFDKLTYEIEFDDREYIKRKFATLREAVGAPDRLEKIANDIIKHFNNRKVSGKAMVVTISRKIAVEMYKLISKIEGAPEVAVIISNPDEFKKDIKGELKAEDIEKRFKNPEDSLKIVVVCDMWLTGFDVPCLSTMYFDKPLKNHTLMQAIARVNRVFKNKQGGLIVDYIGIADDLKKALSKYDLDTRRETMIPLEKIIAKMIEKYDIVRSMLSELDYSNWKYIGEEKLNHLLNQAVEIVISNPKNDIIDEKRKDRFLNESLRLVKLYSFVMPHKEAYEIKDDINFIKVVRGYILKMTVVKNKAFVEENLEASIKELISKSIEAEGVIDIFSFKGKDKLNVSVLDDKFLESVKKNKYKNLTIEILRKLLTNKIKERNRINNVRYSSFLELLEKIIEEYEGRMINASKVLERLIELAKEIRKTDEDARKTGLSEEELAFYDAIVSKKIINNDDEVKKIVKELVKIIRRDITIDWTNSDIIKARIKSNVKLLLLKNRLKPKEVEKITSVVYEQAFYLFRNYERVAM